MLLGFGGILHPEASFLLEPFYPNLKAHTNICKKAACSKRFHIHPHPISKCFQFFFDKHNKTPATFSGFPWFTPPGHPSAAARRQVWSDGHGPRQGEVPSFWAGAFNIRAPWPWVDGGRKSFSKKWDGCGYFMIFRYIS